MKLVIYEEYDQGYARAYGRGITLMREDDVATLLEKMVYHEIHTHLDKQANAPSPDGAFEGRLLA